MPYFVDRRQNPKHKSLGNRQRFVHRARAQIKEIVNQSIKDRNITDVASGETVTIPTKGIGEPHFRQARSGGKRDIILPGNKEFCTGDKVPKPPRGGGDGEGGKKASDSGEGEDEFQFALSRDEFLDLFFDDLELPDLVKTNLKELVTYRQKRAGLTTSGNPTNLNVLRTMRNALGRRIALRRPHSDDVEALQQEILEIEAKYDQTPEERMRLKMLHEALEEMNRRRRVIPFIDPFDIRYNSFQPHPEPNTKAVMFCLMDVSGSMGEREKDLAKRFFVLLHLFLERRYERIEIVFIRHTHEAQEVDEQTFFYSRETGGTVVSTALTKMLEVVHARYPTEEWNIYCAQASDGDNFSGDAEKCNRMLDKELMPLCQYYAYVEIVDSGVEVFKTTPKGSALWRAYQPVTESWSNFAMKRIARPNDIYPVFRQLFATKRDQAGKASSGKTMRAVVR